MKLEGKVIEITSFNAAGYETSEHWVSTKEGIFKPTNSVYHSNLECKLNVEIETMNGNKCRITQVLNVTFWDDVTKVNVSKS